MTYSDTPVEPAAARQQRLAIVSNAAAFISKLDQLRAAPR
jgi:hypothetical protein